MKNPYGKKRLQIEQCLVYWVGPGNPLEVQAQKKLFKTARKPWPSKDNRKSFRL